MKPCFRSLSCLLAVTALALLSTEAAARTDAKQPPGRKTHEANKTPAAKEARPQRSAAVEKRRRAKHADAEPKSNPKSKRSKDEPARKEATPALTGNLALVKEAIDLARKAKTDEATATRRAPAGPHRRDRPRQPGCVRAPVCPGR